MLRRPVLRGAYEGLVPMRGSSTSAIEGVLATSWSHNKDYTVWTFNLRHGVTFHDGTPFNADAVKSSIERTLKMNQAPAFIIGQFVSPSSITVVDPYTLRFKLNGPPPRLLYALASRWGTGIVSPTAIARHTVKNDNGSGWLATHDAGTGPYTFTRVTPSGGVTTVKYAHYWRGWSGAHVSRVIVNYIPEDATHRALVEKGDSDLSNTFTPQDMAAMKGESEVRVDNGYGLQEITVAPTEAGPFASVASAARPPVRLRLCRPAGLPAQRVRRAGARAAATRRLRA